MIKHALIKQEREILSINFPIAPEVAARMTTILSEEEVESNVMGECLYKTIHAGN